MDMVFANSKPADCSLAKFEGQSSTNRFANKDRARFSQPKSIMELWQEFLSNTSIHGCNRVFKQRHWNIIFLDHLDNWHGHRSGMGSCFELLLRYKQYPFTTVWSLRQKTSVAMPAITICLPSNVDMTKLKHSPVIYDYIRKTRSFVEFSSYFNSTKEKKNYLNKTYEYFSRMSLAEFISLAKFGFEDVFIYTRFKIGESKNNCSDSGTLCRSAHDERKACWVVNGGHSDVALERTVTRFDRIEFIIDANSNKFPPHILHTGIEVYVHESHKTHALQKKYFIKPGTRAQISFNRIEHNYLDSPYKSFEGNGCVEKERFRSPLQNLSKYSMGSCIGEKLLINLTKECNCVLPDYRSLFPNISECSFLQFEKCIIYTSHQFRKRAYPAPPKIGCPFECSFATYYLTISTAGFPTKQILTILKVLNSSKNLTYYYIRKNLIFLVIQANDESVQMIEHLPEITFLSIFGTVGGYMGLFLGASLLTLTELFETLILIFWQLLSRICSKNKMIPDDSEDKNYAGNTSVSHQSELC